MSALDKVREPIGRLLRRPSAFFVGEWERWSPKRKQVVTGSVIAIAAGIVLFAGQSAFFRIGDLRGENADIREALASIAQHRDDYLEAKARNAVQEARIGSDPPQLTGDLEAAARGENIQIAESSERPTVPAGKRYLQHDVDIKLREVDLQSLTKFLRRVETGPRLIFFTRLSLKHRYSESDKLDAELTATAFEKAKEDKTKKKPEGAGKTEAPQ